MEERQGENNNNLPNLNRKATYKKSFARNTSFTGLTPNTKATLLDPNQ